MTLWQTSLTYQIWVWLCDVYEDSTLHRFQIGRASCRERV